MSKRYKLIKGLGIHDTQTDEYYITPEEQLWLINHLHKQLEKMKKDEHNRTTQ